MTWELPHFSQEQIRFHLFCNTNCLIIFKFRFKQWIKSANHIFNCQQITFVLLFCSFLLYILSSSITVFFSFYSILIKCNVNFSYVTYIFKWNNKYCFPKIISSSVCLLLLIVPCSLFTRSIPPLNSSPSIDLPWKFSTR